MSWLAIGLLCCAVSVAAGAFGAHGLKTKLEPASLELWETAARYLMYGGLGLSILGVASPVLGRPTGIAAATLLAGTMVFCLTVAALALGAPRWLGAVTPIGGALMILGFFLFALAAWRG